MLAAIRAGVDPVIAATETRKIQADIIAAESVIDRWELSGERSSPLTDVDVREAIVVAGGLVGLLDEADRAERTALYRALGLRLSYEKQRTGRELVHARLDLCSSGGGGI